MSHPLENTAAQLKSNGATYWHDLSGNMLEEIGLRGDFVAQHPLSDATAFQASARDGMAAGPESGSCGTITDASGAHYAYLSDLIGSSVVVSDLMGHIQDSSDYYPGVYPERSRRTSERA